MEFSPSIIEINDRRLFRLFKQRLCKIFLEVFIIIYYSFVGFFYSLVFVTYLMQGTLEDWGYTEGNPKIKKTSIYPSIYLGSGAAGAAVASPLFKKWFSASFSLPVTSVVSGAD